MADRNGDDMKLLCLGYGYTARHFVAAHGPRFAHIAATFRAPEAAPELERNLIEPVSADARHAAQLIAAVQDSDAVLVSAGPDEAGDPFLARVQAALAYARADTRFVYLSTVGVYGDHGGAWVDETTAPRPSSTRSHWRLTAEKAWLAVVPDVQILRLAGIYGPGRNALVNLRAGSAKRIVKPGQVFNRIHVADIATAIAASLDSGPPGAIWNVADNEPAPPQDVVAYAAGLLGVEPPAEIAFADAALTPMARSFYGENKRVSNRAIRERLGVGLRYPTYREGLSALAQAPGLPP